MLKMIGHSSLLLSTRISARITPAAIIQMSTIRIAPPGVRLRGLTGENQTEESASNGGNLPGPPSEGFHSPESVQHPAFYRYQESYPRRNRSPRNCCSRAGDERNAVPVSV